MKQNCPLCAAGHIQSYHQDANRDYLQCRMCQLVFVPQDQRLDAAAEKARYDQHRNDPSDTRYRRFLSRLFHQICSRIPPPAKGLDFGSGPGPTLSVMLSENGYAMRIYDIFYANQPEVLSLEYDFVTCSEVVEHLFEPGTVLKRLLSSLRPGGLLAIMTQLVIDPKRFASWHYIRDPSHVCFFSRDSFRWFAVSQHCRLEFADQDIILLIKI